jgi:hypothetical protein
MTVEPDCAVAPLPRFQVANESRQIGPDWPCGGFGPACVPARMDPASEPGGRRPWGAQSESAGAGPPNFQESSGVRVRRPGTRDSRLGARVGPCQAPANLKAAACSGGRRGAGTPRAQVPVALPFGNARPGCDHTITTKCHLRLRLRAGPDSELAVKRRGPAAGASQPLTGQLAAPRPGPASG